MDFFKKNLRFLRRTQKLKQSDIQKLMGKSSSAVSNWELGKSTPDVPDIVKLAQFFKIDVNDFLTKDLSKEDYEPLPEARPTNHDNIQLLEYAGEEMIETGSMHLPQLAGPHYAVKVTTSALSPVIEQGDTVILRKVTREQFRADAIYLVQCEGEPPVLRRVRPVPGVSEVEFLTAGHHFPPRRVHTSTIVEWFEVVLRITAHRLIE